VMSLCLGHDIPRPGLNEIGFSSDSTDLIRLINGFIKNWGYRNKKYISGLVFGRFGLRRDREGLPCWWADVSR